MLFIAALLLAVASNAPSTDPTGIWQGVMSRGDDRLNVSFHLSAGTPQRATFSAPDLGAIDIPLQRVELGSAIHWDLVGDATTTAFDGQLTAIRSPERFRKTGEMERFLWRANPAHLSLPTKSVTRPFKTVTCGLPERCICRAGRGCIQR